MDRYVQMQENTNDCKGSSPTSDSQVLAKVMPEKYISKHLLREMKALRRVTAQRAAKFLSLFKDHKDERTSFFLQNKFSVAYMKERFIN